MTGASPGAQARAPLSAKSRRLSQASFGSRVPETFHNHTVAHVPQPWWLLRFCQGDPNGLGHHQPPFTALQEAQAFVRSPLGSVWLSPRVPEPRWPEGSRLVSGQTPAPGILIPGSSTAPSRCPWPGLEDPHRELLSFPWPRASRQALPRRPPATHGQRAKGVQEPFLGAPTSWVSLTKTQRAPLMPTTGEPRRQPPEVTGNTWDPDRLSLRCSLRPAQTPDPQLRDPNSAGALDQAALATLCPHTQRQKLASLGVPSMVCETPGCEWSGPGAFVCWLRLGGGGELHQPWPHQPEGPSPKRQRTCGVSHRLPMVRLTEACWVLGGFTAGSSRHGSAGGSGGGRGGAPTRQKSPITSLRPGWGGPAQQGGQKAHHQLQELSGTQTTPTGQGSQDHPSCPLSHGHASQPPRPLETPPTSQGSVLCPQRDTAGAPALRE